MTMACSSTASTPHCAPLFSTHRRSIVAIGAVSVAVHAALFAIPWHRDAPSNHVAGEPAKMTYTLQATGAPAIAHGREPTEPTPTLKRSAAQRNITPRPARTPTPTPAATAMLSATAEHPSAAPGTHEGNADTEKVANAPSAPSTTALSAAHVGPGESAATLRVAMHPALILDAVRREFDRTKHYPTVAQRRAWQGDVILGFRVERDGHIDDVHIRSGSGYALLDDAAAETLRRISLRDQTRTLYLDIDVELELPVSYRLVEPG